MHCRVATSRVYSQWSVVVGALHGSSISFCHSMQIVFQLPLSYYYIALVTYLLLLFPVHTLLTKKTLYSRTNSFLNKKESVFNVIYMLAFMIGGRMNDIYVTHMCIYNFVRRTHTHSAWKFMPQMAVGRHLQKHINLSLEVSHLLW